MNATQIVKLIEERVQYNTLEGIFDPNTKHDVRVMVKQLCAAWNDKSDVKRKDVYQQILKDSWKVMHDRQKELEVRYLYAFASLFKISELLSRSPGTDTLKECMKTCDLALIMTLDVKDGLLKSVATMINDLIPKESNPLDQNPITHSTLPEIKSWSLEMCTSIDCFTFQTMYLMKGKPCHLPKLVSDWPAVDVSSGRKWTLSRLRQLIGHRTVPVEVGAKYTDDDWTQKLLTVGEFIDKYIHGPTTEKAYIAQVNLFDIIPCLHKDFTKPDLTCVSREGSPDTLFDIPTLVCSLKRYKILEENAWFGPEGTVSPLHFDDKDNIFTQVMGVKYIRLYSSDIPLDIIKPKTDPLLKNTSQIDIDLLDEKEVQDLKRTGLFKEFFESDTKKFMTEVILCEGDALFIPKNTWHFVKSLSTSFSISFWWT